MNNRKFKNGDTVQHINRNGVNMMIININVSDNSVDCRYWNKKQQRFEDIALYNFEIELDHSPQVDYNQMFTVGDIVQFALNPSPKMVVIENNHPSYLCRIWDKNDSVFKEETFFRFELVLKSEEDQNNQASMLSVFG